MLLGRKHEDGEDQLSGQEHLNEETLGDGCASPQGCLHVQGPREQTGHDGGGAHACQHLRYEEQSPSCVWQCPNQAHAQGDGRVEQAAGDAEEDPCVDGEGEAEAQADVEELGRIGGLGDGGGIAGLRLGVGDLGAGVGEEEEEEGTDELASHGHKMALSRLWKAVEEGEAGDVIFCILASFAAGQDEAALVGIVDIHDGDVLDAW